MKKYLIVFIIVVLFIILLATYLDYKNSNKSKENDILSSTSTALLSTSTLENNQNKNINNMENENKNYKTAILHTNLGNITFEFAKDKPLTTENFKKLASSKFYDGVKFHRVISEFMIQTGDPLSKDETKKDYWGTGGPGYKFNDELTGAEKYEIGTVAMANSGPNTNGSQFFIMTSNMSLPPNYTVFGKVISGQEIAQKIQDVKTDSKDRPLENVIINSVELK